MDKHSFSNRQEWFRTEFCVTPGRDWGNRRQRYSLSLPVMTLPLSAWWWWDGRGVVGARDRSVLRAWCACVVRKLHAWRCGGETTLITPSSSARKGVIVGSLIPSGLIYLLPLPPLSLYFLFLLHTVICPSIPPPIPFPRRSRVFQY